MYFENRKISYISIIFVITAVIIYQFFEYNIEKKENQVLQTLNKKAIEIDVSFKESKKLLEKLARDLEKVPFEKEAHLELMKKTNKQMGTHSIFSGFKDGTYFDTQGYWIEGFDPRTRPWYKEALENKKTVVSGPMYYVDISGQTIAWWAASAILYKDGKAFGVVGSEFLSEMAIGYLKEIKTDDMKNLFLFQKGSGIISTAIDRDNELEKVQDIFSEELFNKIMQSKDNDIITFTHNDVSKKAFIVKLKESPGILCAIK